MHFLPIAALVLLALQVAPAAGAVHADYAHTWAEPTLGSTALWNGGNGASAGFDLPFLHRIHAGIELIYDRLPRETFHGGPSVSLVGGGMLHLASSLVMVELARLDERGAGCFMEAGSGVGEVAEDPSWFRVVGQRLRVRAPGERFLAPAFALGFGYRTAPLIGDARIELGARWLLVATEDGTVPDEPIRVGVSL